MLRLDLRGARREASGEIFKVGVPGALSYGYQSIRGLIVNMLTLGFVGSMGVSAFAASNSFLGLFWAIPGGMLAVSRMMISVSVGEEDRESLQNVMRIMFLRYLPLMSVIALALMAAAVPLTHLYYQDPGEPVFMMTVWGFRILPLSMPLSIILMHFVCYAQVSGKKLMMHLLPLVDGVLGSAISTALLIPFMGMNSVYWANVINGIVTTVIIVGDHESMDNGYFERNVDPQYQRMLYNCFVNTAARPTYTKNRQWTAMDLFPTTLAALGCTIDGNRLGLGTNLFSNQITLCEKYGFEQFNEELSKAADYYEEKQMVY
jgi:hypothetical protein